MDCDENGTGTLSWPDYTTACLSLRPAPMDGCPSTVACSRAAFLSCLIYYSAGDGGKCNLQKSGAGMGRGHRCTSEAGRSSRSPRGGGCGCCYSYDRRRKVINYSTVTITTRYLSDKYQGVDEALSHLRGPTVIGNIVFNYASTGKLRLTSNILWTPSTRLYRIMQRLTS